MKKLRITVGSKTYDVTVEVLSDETLRRPVSAPPTTAAPVRPATSAPSGGSAKPAAQPKSSAPGAVTSPMAGQVKSILVKEGDAVEQGQVVVILEAMKMDNKVTAGTAGTVRAVHVQEGDSVLEGHELVEIE